MTCDLIDAIGKYSKKISEAEDEYFVFSSNTIPLMPGDLSTESIIVKKSHHDYSGYTNTSVSAISIQAHKITYKYLGLLILSKLFHQAPQEIHFNLTHPSSEIKRLILDYQYPTEENSHIGYFSQRFLFKYYPQPIIGRHPFIHHPDTSSLPLFNLTNDEDCLTTHEDWNNRNVIRGFGRDKGNILFAELLLNFSRTHETLDEINLEGELGFRSVGPGSVEVNLYLPGSLGWDGEF